jgi:arylsulfatase
MAAAVIAFLKTLAIEPPIKTGTPDPYLPPKPGELRLEEHLQIGVITQYIPMLVKTQESLPQVDPGLGMQGG